VTHRNAKGQFDQDQNYPYMVRDYYSARAAMGTGYYRALQKNRDAAAAGKPLFCPPAKDPELSSSEISAYFDTLPLDYRQKTAMIDAMLGFAIARFPCPGDPRR
jgi:hypothetical protein